MAWSCMQLFFLMIFLNRGYIFVNVNLAWTIVESLEAYFHLEINIPDTVLEILGYVYEHILEP